MPSNDPAARQPRASRLDEPSSIHETAKPSPEEATIEDLRNAVQPLPGSKKARSEFRRALEAVVHVHHEEWKRIFYKSARRCRQAIEQTADPQRKLKVFRSGFEELRKNLIRLQERLFGDLLGLPKPI